MLIFIHLIQFVISMMKIRDVNETRETQENCSLSRIVYLATENLRLLDRMLTLRRFNDGRYVKPTAGSLRASESKLVELTDSVTYVG